MFCLKFIFVCIHVSSWVLRTNSEHITESSFYYLFVTNNGDALCFWFSGETHCVVLLVISVCQDIVLSWRVDVQLEAVCYLPTRLHGGVSQKAVICIFFSFKYRGLFMFLFFYANVV